MAIRPERNEALLSQNSESAHVRLGFLPPSCDSDIPISSCLSPNFYPLVPWLAKSEHLQTAAILCSSAHLR
jgi:hypothetical protein